MKLAISGLGFSKEEIQKRKQLGKLFDTWLKRMLDAGMPNDWEHSFVPDGFYPGYLSQKLRVLFIGREPHHLSGDDYVETLLNTYYEKKSLNRSRFLSLLMYVTYGLMTGMRNYGKIPCATEIAETFGKPNGISFAFMNLSKLSNQKGWTTDWKQINDFLQYSQGATNLLNQEIAILAPDLIVTMNLGGHLYDLGEIAYVYTKNDDVAVLELAAGDTKIPVFDTYHFSAPGKSPDADIFTPLMKEIDRYMKRRCRK